MSYTQGRISIGTDFVTVHHSGGATSTARILERTRANEQLVGLLLDRVIHSYGAAFEDVDDRTRWEPSGCFGTELKREST